MKTATTTLSETNFRQLTSYEIDYPLYGIGKFWILDAYIEDFRMEVFNWIKTACSLSNDQFGDPDEFELLHHQCIKLLEIAHILYTSEENFKIEKDHPVYRNVKACFGYYLENEQILSCPHLYFRKLVGNEVNDVNIFFEEFFDYRSLTEWYDILDQLLISSREESSVVKNEEIGPVILEINEYLEKLMESIGVVFETKALAYITRHHPELLD
ncbi:hypothetical protein SAMN05421820_101835 [Pedobacter steynii]|uniref:Uncharacterized protein n=1 Tax=Pedobacter steynii TaxID=430522 RepID=A0A1G9LBM9_9SPHI|nr:hypothetical protein [Pedobacter steynii]NQX38800.1 hypothetical protein [Pedobacter steynii]SDL59246.1 hypothetical protein SAMN05421820_101835 [Pedobacter steynii]